MATYPLLDHFGAPVLTGLFVALLLVERCWPLRRRVDRWLRRIIINAAVAVPSFVVLRLLLIPIVIAAATWARGQNFGIVRGLGLTPWPAGIVAILLLDYTMFLWHWLNHRVPLLWRFHHVHHSDLDLDVSTSFRFHFGEILLSVLVRSIQVMVAGASPAAALIYEILLEASTAFHHSNLRLPITRERGLSWLIMTPRAHGIHHSIVGRETNSNYSNLLILWDRLHGTLRLNVRQETVVVGVPEYRVPHELGALSLLLMPFRRQRRPLTPGDVDAAGTNPDQQTKTRLLR
jgi:sterol desaturase/sphingolipid hydroxylase (fatty acid hydroxylase superfamily)